ncbi:MAG: DEAD/DEAH box helicase [Armatimonadota bacterium]|nr:DEAD/DEAH box helicase [Armatimonadota bacterium]
MNSDEFLAVIKRRPEYKRQIVHTERIPARPVKYASLESPLNPLLEQALCKQRIDHLYSHQAKAISAARKGEHVIVVTSTASGKTLCYNAPVIESILVSQNNRALYIFPTKALAQDQLGKLRELGLPMQAATFDGDTPNHERRIIKKSSQIILTNPDMLHVGILPYHATWSSFFKNLKYIVIDEIHSYRGVFGSHVANIMRRLRRICAHYGAEPQFIASSATIANPGGLMTTLTGLEPTVIDEDGSPSGEKIFVFWNPPYLGYAGERRSANSEATFLLTELAKARIRHIVFTKARKTAEIILRYARAQLAEEGFADVANRIMSYRAGYRPEDRREIEKRLFSGDLIGVTSTTALELGVDVGGLDACVLTGYPGTVASTWQQAGRAGRGVSQSLAILIALDNPLDQFLMKSPDYFFGRSHETAVVDPSNPYLLASHALCAAYELPLTEHDFEIFGPRLGEVLAVLTEAGELTYRGRWFWSGSRYPAADVNIRSASSENYQIIDTAKPDVSLGIVDGARVFETVHSGAVYLHAGESYVVERLDLTSKIAYVMQADVSYFTEPATTTSLDVKETVENSQMGNTERFFGDVLVTNQVIGYRKKQLFTDELIETRDLDLPPSHLETEALWFPIPQKMADILIGREYDLPGSIHAIEHAAIGILPLFAMCDRQDIGGVSNPAHAAVSGQPVIFIYDGYPGGVGIAQSGYDRLEELLEATLKAIDDCPCDDGCPSCVQSPKCGNNNEPLDKDGAVFLLRMLLG